MNKTIIYDYFYNQINNDLVQQYFSLRTEAFIDQWGLKHFYGGPDKYDKDAITLIAHKSGVCVGGARLIVNNNINSDYLLPMETKDFKLKNLFPELELENKTYAELSRFVVLDNYRDNKCSSEICKNLVGIKAASLDINYIFCVTAPQLARISGITFRRLGIPFEVQKNIKVPDLPTYEGHKMVLSLIDLTNINSTKYQERLKIKDTVW